MDKPIVVLAGFFAAMFIGLMAFGLLRPNTDPSNPPCYFVQDSFGVEHGSYYPPQPGDGGEVFYQRDDGWGIRFDAKGIRVDRDCLRRRGVQVDPIPTEVDTP